MRRLRHVGPFRRLPLAAEVGRLCVLARRDEESRLRLAALARSRGMEDVARSAHRAGVGELAATLVDGSVRAGAAIATEAKLRAAADAVRTLEDSGIRSCVIESAATILLDPYADVESYCSSDVDLLVDREVTDAEASLEAAGWHIMPTRLADRRVASKGTVTLEVTGTLAERTWSTIACRLDLDGLDVRQHQRDDYQLPVPAVDAGLVAAAIHASLHYYCMPPRWRLIWDLDAFASHPETDLSRARAIALAAGCFPRFWVGLRVLQLAIGTSIPQTVMHIGEPGLRLRLEVAARFGCFLLTKGRPELLTRIAALPIELALLSERCSVPAGAGDDSPGAACG